MLHLDAGVHLDEIELPLLVEKEFHGPGVAVTFLCSNPDGGCAEFLAGPGRESERGGKFHHLLVAPLDGAVPFIEVDDVAVHVPEHLDLDMLGIFDVAFKKNRCVAEGGFRLAPGRD